MEHNAHRLTLYSPALLSIPQAPLDFIDFAQNLDGFLHVFSPLSKGTRHPRYGWRTPSALEPFTVAQPPGGPGDK